MATTPQPQATTAKALHDSALEACERALSIAKKCGCMLCASFIDAMSKSGYASGPQGSGGQGTAASGAPARPGLRPGEGAHPAMADRDLVTGVLNARAMSPIEIGRMSHTEQVDRALALMRRQMTLSEHLTLLGHDVDSFSFRAKLPKEVIRNAIDGKPIAAAHAQRIALQLSREHNLHSKSGFEHGDIANLHVIDPDELK